MMYLENCCCYCTLKTGTLIIGYLNLVITALIWLVSLVSLLFVDESKSQYDTTGTLDFFLFLIFSVALAVDVLLVVGAHKGRSKYLLPWIGSAILGGIGFTLTELSQLGQSGNGVFVELLSLALALGLHLYFLFVVVSFRQELIRMESELQSFPQEPQSYAPPADLESYPINQPMPMPMQMPTQMSLPMQMPTQMPMPMQMSMPMPMPTAPMRQSP